MTVIEVADEVGQTVGYSRNETYGSQIYSENVKQKLHFVGITEELPEEA